MRIGLFPLGIVLFPTEQIPLHIFEPRYRELIADCRREESPFGLVFADDSAGVRQIGTFAHVVDVEDLDDGRLNIIVEGRERFRIVEETAGRPFTTAEVERVPDTDDSASVELAEQALTLFDRLVALTETDVERPATDHPQLSYAIGGHFDLSADLKQGLLEELSERVRLEAIHSILEGSHEAIAARREIALRAQRNGKH
jgi:ATP-dependent Lon protease